MDSHFQLLNEWKVSFEKKCGTALMESQTLKFGIQQVDKKGYISIMKR